MAIRSLIIDDDPFIHTLLKDKLEAHFPEIEVLHSSRNGTEGIEHIREFQPELIFLDVEMTDMTGFEMLGKLDQIHFQTIFITSYSHYAIKAIRFNALDYILKPIDLGDLKEAINRFKILRQQGLLRNYNQVLRNFETPNPAEQTLILNLQEGEVLIPIREIIQVIGERNYSYLILQNDREKLVSKTLGDFEDILSAKGFFRCHKSHLVNHMHIESFLHKMLIRLSNQSEVPISRRRKEDFDLWYEDPY